MYQQLVRRRGARRERRQRRLRSFVQSIPISSSIRAQRNLLLAHTESRPKEQALLLKEAATTMKWEEKGKIASPCATSAHTRRSAQSVQRTIVARHALPSSTSNIYRSGGALSLPPIVGSIAAISRSISGSKGLLPITETTGSRDEARLRVTSRSRNRYLGHL